MTVMNENRASAVSRWSSSACCIRDDKDRVVGCRRNVKNIFVGIVSNSSWSKYHRCCIGLNHVSLSDVSCTHHDRFAVHDGKVQTCDRSTDNVRHKNLGNIPFVPNSQIPWAIEEILFGQSKNDVCVPVQD